MSVDGELTLTVDGHTAYDGVDVSDFISAGGKMAPSVFVIIASVSGYAPNDPFASLQVYPSGQFKIGADSNGNLGVVRTFVNVGNDIHFVGSNGQGVNLVQGLWKQKIRANFDFTKFVNFDITYSYPNPNSFGPGGDFAQNLTKVPTAIVPTYDPTKPNSKVDFSFHYDNAIAPVENPVAFVLMRRKVGETVFAPVGSVPYDGSTDYTLSDIPGQGSWQYIFRTYNYGTPNLISVDSVITSVNFTAVPNFIVNGGYPTYQFQNFIPLEFVPEEFDFTLLQFQPLIFTPLEIPEITAPPEIPLGPFPNLQLVNSTIDVGGGASMQFILEPSGIYTLVEGKTHDTLYSRTSPTSTDVAIPNPFAVTSFLGQ